MIFGRPASAAESVLGPVAQMCWGARPALRGRIMSGGDFIYHPVKQSWIERTAKRLPNWLTGR